MARQYLLDTNIISALMRDPRGAVAARIRMVGEAAVATSVIVAGELRFGARKAGSGVWVERVEKVLAAIEVLPLDAGVDAHYGSLRAYLTQRGQPIGPNDLWIAAHALALGATLVTANTDEFTRAPDLQVENWLSQLGDS